MSSTILTLDDNIEYFVKNLPDNFKFIINLKDYEEISKKIDELSELDKINLFFILNYYYHIDGESLIEDQIYDKLVENYSKYITDIFNSKVELPYPMPGLKKVYPDNKKSFMNFINKFVDYNINVSSKLDGVSCLLVKNKTNNIDLYTKGKDNIGRKLNHILKYINIKGINEINTNKKLVLRGELIIKKENNKYFNIKSSLRSQVIGLINRKNINKNLLQYIDLVFYEVKIPVLSKKDQLNLLNKLNLNTVKNINIDTSKEQNIIKHLIEIYKTFSSDELYEIDGLVISDLNTVIQKDEEYNFALKFNTIYGVTKVVNIQWNISKDNKFIPKILIEPIVLGKIRVSKISGFNAAYIVKNKIGIGAEIKIKYSGNVIPVLDNVIIPSADIPIPSESFWDKNKIHLLSNNINILESLAKQIEKFYIIFKIKSFAYKSIYKILVFISENNKIENIFDYIDILNSYRAQNIKILGETKDKMLYDSLDVFKTYNISITSLLAATNKFVLMDERKILNILKNSPLSLDIITNKISFDMLTIESLKNIEDVSDITAENFINGLKYYIDNSDKFEEYFNINYNVILKENLLKIVFTKIKSKDKQIIYQYQDYFIEYVNVSKNIDYLVIKDNDFDEEEENISEKHKKAIKYNIPIITIKELLIILKKLKK
jgi:DNA ligase (NAD+)